MVNDFKSPIAHTEGIIYFMKPFELPASFDGHVSYIFEYKPILSIGRGEITVEKVSKAHDLNISRVY